MVNTPRAALKVGAAKLRETTALEDLSPEIMAWTRNVEPELNVLMGKPVTIVDIEVWRLEAEVLEQEDKETRSPTKVPIQKSFLEEAM